MSKNLNNKNFNNNNNYNNNFSNNNNQFNNNNQSNNVFQYSNYGNQQYQQTGVSGRNNNVTRNFQREETLVSYLFSINFFTLCFFS